MTVNKTKSKVIINFKRLRGQQVFELSEKLNEAYDVLAGKYDIILAVQAVDAMQMFKYCRYKVFIQDTFSEEEYSFLNYFKEPFCLHDNVAGVILNHPEKKLPADVLGECINKANELKIETLICATTIEEAVIVNQYAPCYIGIENENLIGKDVSFIEHCPEIVQQAKLRIQRDILIGAGIRSTQDLSHVINTGGAGVLISSIILKSANPLNTLLNFLC